MLIVVAIATIGGLLITSNAVLIGEKEVRGSTGLVLYSGFQCTYFTGTRTFDIYTEAVSGCTRFTPVGK